MTERNMKKLIKSSVYAITMAIILTFWYVVITFIIDVYKHTYAPQCTAVLQVDGSAHTVIIPCLE